jgi:hypothetical protein
MGLAGVESNYSSKPTITSGLPTNHQVTNEFSDQDEMAI